MFLEDSKRDLGFGDCKIELSTSAPLHWHTVMLA